MIFQDFNLFDHLTALGNVEVGMVRVKKMKKRAARDRAMADEVIFMDSGRIVEQGAPDRLLGPGEGGRIRDFCVKIAEIDGE
jgi:ABC-type polar amino acid transport system ATPase subunit